MPFSSIYRSKENKTHPSLSSAPMSNSTSISMEVSLSSETRAQHEFTSLSSLFTPHQHCHQLPLPNPKKKRNQPGNPDPDAEVIALSPKTLMATNRFVCDICNKGFKRDQNLQLHRRGHNLPWKLRQRGSKEGVVRKRVYVCPEASCVHHHPSRALGDITGIKKHFSRKHGEKKWKCERCSKKYAVHSDWKAHVKTCGTREYKCDCGTLFIRKDSFITHRAFCDALAEEYARIGTGATGVTNSDLLHQPLFLPFSPLDQLPNANPNPNPSITPNPNTNSNPYPFVVKREEPLPPLLQPYLYPTITVAATSPHMSATALVQKVSTKGTLPATFVGNGYFASNFNVGDIPIRQRGNRWIRNFAGVVAGENELMSLTGLSRDPVTASTCNSSGIDNLTIQPLATFTPVAEAWSDH